MALFQPYCSAEDVQGHTHNSDLLTSTLDSAINMASRYVDEFTGRLFHYYDHSNTSYSVPNMDFIDGKYIYLPFPVIQLFEVEISATDVESDNYSFIGKPSDYKHRSVIELTATTTTDFLGQSTSTASTDAILKGTFGFSVFDSTRVPDDSQFPAGIRRATTLIASAFTEMNRKEQIALDGTRVPVATYDVPDEATDILNMHKRQVVV